MPLDTATVRSQIRRKAGLRPSVTHLSNADEPSTTMPTRYLVSLGRNIVYAIVTAKKNGTAIVITTDYDWVTGRPNVGLVAQPAKNDFFEFEVDTGMTDTAINDYITSAEREAISKLMPFYDDTGLSTYPTVENIIKNLALGRIKQDMSEGVALESARYRSGLDLEKTMTEVITGIQRGEFDIIDSSGGIVTRRSGAIVGGFRHVDGKITERKDIRDRLAAFDGFALAVYPFNASNVKGSR